MICILLFTLPASVLFKLHLSAAQANPRTLIGWPSGAPSSPAKTHHSRLLGSARYNKQPGRVSIAHHFRVLDPASTNKRSGSPTQSRMPGKVQHGSITISPGFERLPGVVMNSEPTPSPNRHQNTMSDQHMSLSDDQEPLDKVFKNLNAEKRVTKRSRAQTSVALTAKERMLGEFVILLLVVRVHGLLQFFLSQCSSWIRNLGLDLLLLMIYLLLLLWWWFCGVLW